MATIVSSGAPPLGGGVVTKQTFNITAAPDGTEQSTGIVLPADCIVLDVLVDVDVEECTGSNGGLDVGTDGAASNDPNGFFSALQVNTSTTVRRGSVVTTVGANNTFLASNDVGALLGTLIPGQDVVDGGDGAFVRHPDVSSGGDTVTYTALSNDWVEFRGKIHVIYVDLT